MDDGGWAAGLWFAIHHKVLQMAAVNGGKRIVGHAGREPRRPARAESARLEPKPLWFIPNQESVHTT